jgi:hypothetical protein
MDNYIRKLYYFIYLLFYRIYISFFPIAKQIHVPSILDLTNKYIEVRTKRFLESFDKTMDFNTNIEKEFYEKDKYKQLIMHPSNRLESNWKRRILFETTPRGNIIMYYDAYKQGFAYYSDSYNLPYGLLNTVAMKYVMTYSCRDFFMDDDITPDNKESPLIKIHMDEPEKKNDVKKNNMKKTLNRINTISKNFSEQKTQNNLNQKKSNPNIENIIITNTNRFIYLGKIINFNFLQSVSNVNTSLNGFGSNLLDNLVGETKLQKSVMDYKEYKNLRNRKVETSW